MKLIFVMPTGEVETTFAPPYSVREQIAWEERFKLSFYVVQRSMQAMGEAARGESEEIDGEYAFKVSWLLFFGWMRARPNVPPRFDVFLDTLVDWRDEAEPSDQETIDAASDALPAVEATSGVDPTTSTSGLRSVQAG